MSNKTFEIIIKLLDELIENNRLTIEYIKNK